MFKQLQLKVNVQILLHLNLLIRKRVVFCKRNFTRLDMSYSHAIMRKVYTPQHKKYRGEKCHKKLHTSQGKKNTHCPIIIPKDKHINMKMVKPYEGNKKVGKEQK